MSYTDRFTHLESVNASVFHFFFCICSFVTFWFLTFFPRHSAFLRLFSISFIFTCYISKRLYLSLSLCLRLSLLFTPSTCSFSFSIVGSFFYTRIFHSNHFVLIRKSSLVLLLFEQIGFLPIFTVSVSLVNKVRKIPLYRSTSLKMCFSQV